MSTVIAEDSGLLRDGLVGMLERFDFSVQAAVANATELLRAVDEHDPQLVITDVRMPPTFKDEGLKAALALRATHPRTAIVVLSQYVEHTSASQLLAGDNGRVGYLLKDRVADVRQLVASLHQVLEGGTVVDPEVVRRLLGRKPLTRLTAREHETLALMAEGHSNSAIAKRLVVTETTVAKHIRNVFDKLDLPPTEDHHRRVLAVVAYLQSQ